MDRSIFLLYVAPSIGMVFVAILYWVTGIMDRRARKRERLLEGRFDPTAKG
jgi:hypothetical protein